MQSRIASVLAGAALIALPLTAMAAGSGDRPAFDQVDADGNGKISMEEASKAGVPQAEAKREDIDNDGKLTKADWKFVDLEESGDSSS